MGQECAILAETLTKRFGDFTAVNRITFSIERGKIFGFLGPNGAGKSTTIRMLCGILKPTSGKAYVAGIDVEKDPDLLKMHIGYMSQKFSLYQDLTVEENIALYAGIYGIDNRIFKEKHYELLNQLDLLKKRDIPTKDLPTGWKQRLSLACAIFHDPDILFLDEPTSGVDPEARREFWNLLYDLSSKGTTVLVTSHYMEEAEQCQRIGMIFDGKLAAKGTPKEIKETIPGAIYEAEHPQIQKVLEALKGIPGIAAVSPFGKSLHILSTEPHLSAGIIAKSLEEKGLKKVSIREIPPSLEDVFIYLFKQGN